MRPVSAFLVSLLIAACAAGCAGTSEPSSPRYTFYLTGGYFYGPGPIVPDTSLPDGRLVNIRFDPRDFQGYAEFFNDDREESKLSDGRTRINLNIDAGRLRIGGGYQTVLLVAVDGGPQRGTEQYYLDEDYRFVWRVDLALDPGFEEGIIRVDDFILHTGVARVAPSLQTQNGLTGGYDQAGSLKTGQLLLGRVGDFDQDGFLDGILVAAPNVPMAADLLPGAPVGNRRGFYTDVPITPNISAELILRGMLDMAAAFEQAAEQRDRDQHETLLRDARERLAATTANLKRASTQKSWQRPEVKAKTLELLDRVLVIAREGLPPSGGQDNQLASRIAGRFRADIGAAVEMLAAVNLDVGDALPAKRRPRVLDNSLVGRRDESR